MELGSALAHFSLSLWKKGNYIINTGVEKREKYLTTGVGQYLEAQLTHRGGGDPVALHPLVVDLGLLLLRQPLICFYLLRQRHSRTGETESPVLLVLQSGVDLLAEEQQVLLEVTIEVTIPQVMLEPETIKTKVTKLDEIREHEK